MYLDAYIACSHISFAPIQCPFGRRLILVTLSVYITFSFYVLYTIFFSCLKFFVIFVNFFFNISLKLAPVLQNEGKCYYRSLQTLYHFPL